MLHSNIERILRDNIAGNEELKGLESHFHSIGYEIDNMANKSDPDMNMILHRAKELISRALVGHHDWLNSNWNKIEDDIEQELRELKK